MKNEYRINLRMNPNKPKQKEIIDFFNERKNDDSFSRNEFIIEAILGRIQQSRARDSQAEKINAVCPVCGMNSREFRNGGRLGCAACYKAFREPVEEQLMKLNGSAVYVGQSPSGNSVNADIYRIKKLRADMQKAISEEEFELAASLRDQIRSLSDAEGKRDLD